MGNWITDHKEIFLTGAILLMTLSFAAAIHEKRKKGKNSGLLFFSIALVITTLLLTYNKIKYGYFI